MSHTSTFGYWLRQRRKALGLTQKELAQQAGCAEVTLRKIESGDLSPSPQLAACLAKAVGATSDDLPGLVAVARILDPDLAPAERRILPRRPNNLTAQLTPLIGRHHDIAAVRKRLISDDARLVTLVGPPGVGKTRLAQAVAEDVLEHFNDGVFFVRLGSITDPTIVASAIAQSLDLQMTGSNPPALQLRSFLEEKHLLLILDNFEHVVKAAPLIDDLLRRCLWLHALVTSRQPLRLRGERQVPVLPLALPTEASGARLLASDALRYPAVALFAERAEAVEPSFDVTDANAGAIAELCRRLDGLPLAIELIAARVRLLPPAELVARLRGPWMLSADGLRDVSARQKTLRGAIRWSYDLLSPAEQTLLMRLAVFVDGCTLEAAEAVCGEETSSPVAPCHEMQPAALQVFDGIASLLDKSLLHRETGRSGESRYVLFETVREFAMEQFVAAAEESQARNRHLAWCLSLAATAVPSPFSILEQTGWKQIDAEIHNLRAGLAWAFQSDAAAALRLVPAISRTLANRGFVREARTWIDRGLALTEAADATVDRAALLYGKGITEFLADDPDAAEASMVDLLTLSRQLNLVLGQAGAKYYLGRLASMTGDAQRAEAFLESAAGDFLEAGEIIDWGHVISILAEIAMFRGDLQRSRSLHMQAVTRKLPPDQRHQVFWSVGGLAELAHLEGDLAEAERLAKECLALCLHRDNPGEIAWPLTCLGEIATRRGDFAAARAYLDEALALGKQADSYWRIAIVQADLADLAVAEGKPGEAFGWYRASLPVMLQRGIFAYPPSSLRLACLAGAVNQHEVAATLLAACSAAVEDGIEVLLSSTLTQSDFDRALAATKAALDTNAFEGAWMAGRSLSPEAAVTWGLQAIRVTDNVGTMSPGVFVDRVQDMRT